jgi:hypothetical protein
MTVGGKTAAVVACALLSVSPHRRAGADEPIMVSGELGGASLLSEPQVSLFGAGATLAVSAFRPVRPSLLAGLRLRFGFFADGPAPEDPNLVDPGAAGSAAALVALRWRPLVPAGESRLSTGLWVEGALGGGLDGAAVRPMGEAGIGWGFPLGPVVAGPMIRYQRLVQFGDGDDGNDAQALLFGLEVAWPGRAAPAATPAPAAKVRPRKSRSRPRLPS